MEIHRSHSGSAFTLQKLNPIAGEREVTGEAKDVEEELKKCERELEEAKTIVEKVHPKQVEDYLPTPIGSDPNK
jgi:hypothetical protein